MIQDKKYTFKSVVNNFSHKPSSSRTARKNSAGFSAKFRFLLALQRSTNTFSSLIHGQRPNVCLDRDNSGYINLNNNQTHLNSSLK